MIMQEQLRKKVVKFGNGSIVYTPKNWIGREVIITLPKLSMREELFKLLDPYLLHIQGIYLYGSFARNEQEQDSDIDVLIIADKKFKIKMEGYDINVLTIDDLKKPVDPFCFLMLKEAKTILNGQLLDKIKPVMASKKSIRWILNNTKSVLKINRDFIDLEDESFENDAVIYSLMLRLRGLYMIDCVLKNKCYSNENFNRFVKTNGIRDDFYRIYRKVRDNKNVKIRVMKNDVKILYETVKNETEKKSREIH